MLCTSSGSSLAVPPLEELGWVLPISGSDSTLSSPDGLVIWVDACRLPVATSQRVSFVLYTPPDTSRLRFLAVSPSTAQSTEQSKLQVEAAKQDAYSACKVPKDGDDMTVVLALLNSARKIQRRLDPAEPGFAARFNVRALQGSGSARGRRNWVSSALLTVVSTALSDIYIGDINLGSICQHCAAVKHMCLRLEQLATIPERFSETRLDPEIDVSIRSVKYMAFWNSVWLIFNDLILGYTAYEFFHRTTPTLAASLPVFFKESRASPDVVPADSQTYLVEHILSVLQFFNDWPIGLKLNTPLSQFLCTTLGLVIQSWSTLVTPHLESSSLQLFAFLSVASAGGLGLVVAALQDLLSLFALHLRICSFATSAMCRWQLSSLHSLWNVFRGKRWNVLRQRTDSYAYDVDQLFLGTLLFTVSIFLLPTVLTYSALFAITRLALSAVDSALGLTVNALNAFPLFEILLRIKEPSRLPAGITFELTSIKAREALPPSAYPVQHVLQLCENAPRSFYDILRPLRP